MNRSISKIKCITVLVFSGIAALVYGCTIRSTTQIASDEKQSEIIRLLIAAWNDGKVDHLQQHGAESVLLHYRGESRYTSFEDLKGLIAHWRQAFPDFQMHIQDVITEGDLTAVRLKYEGTHEGTWFGNKPTGKRMQVDEMMFFRFEKGKLVEAWEVDDQLTMQRQLGLIQ